MKFLKKADVFVQTERKLTFTYTWLIILFLVLFSIIVSVFFGGMAYRENRQLIRTTMYATENGSPLIPDLVSSDHEDLYFYYLVNGSGNVVGGSEVFPLNNSINLEMIEEWHPNKEEFRLKWLSVPHSHHEGKTLIDRDRLLFVGARPAILQDGKKGTIYVAKDVTFYLDVFQNLLIVFLCILVIFFIAAVWLSLTMSKKAMIPIQRSYRQQQQFLADASHELRTPLSIMNTSLDVIELENGKDFTSYTKEVIVDMKEEVGRMSRMVHHLLLLARSDSGSVEFEIVAFDLVPRMRQWVQAFEAIANQKEIVLNAHLPRELSIKGDIERMKQLVYILLDNAIKYTPKHGNVNVIVDQQSKQWSLAIQDTGVGIPIEDRRRIFDRFYRVEKHRSRDEGSAGLGLSIAKWIVEAHHGSIEVESVVNQGSTFTVKFTYLE
ncbi:sensor histidine kinase [Paenibacillus pectinilyticus]|uniref:sensor histidine kinase n=1 Tax=Paenibacillus pectinilyticus TaxID=512399 RepID=UPI000AC69408|nr:ATP-binding protein [Paenibacillus pectinilyticus]